MKSFVSDESLNAFIDGEFDVVESESLIAQMRHDPELAKRVGALRDLQSMVRLAYAEPPVTRGWVGDAAPRRQFMQHCAFGCFILLVGLTGGWLLHSLERQAVTESPTLFSAHSAAIEANGFQTASLVHKADPNKLLLHIDSASPKKMKDVLDQAEALLDQAEQQGRSMQIEILANNHGLELLRTGVSPYAERIALMKKRHVTLQFVACSQAIARFNGEGKKVVLLPAATTAPTAISEIVTRLQQGWTYVRV